MRRVAGCILALALLTGGAAACGSSGGSDKASGTTVASGGNTSSSNADVKAYCDAVDAYVKKVQAAKTDTSKLAALSAEGQDLAKKAQNLATAGLSSKDAQDVAACTKKSTDALTGG